MSLPHLTKRNKLIALVILAALAAVAAYLWIKENRPNWISQAKDTLNIGGAGGAYSTPQYPVTVTSKSDWILAAFKEAGYWNLLSDTQKAEAQRDPQAWLKQHPYLAREYSKYFTLLESSSASMDQWGI